MLTIERFPLPLFGGSKVSARILIVDDDISCLDLLRSNFENEGYRVEIASDGYSGRQKALESKPDLIVSDILMPGVDGLAMVQSLKERSELEDVPVIFISGQAADNFVPNEPGAGKRYALLKKPLYLPEMNQLVRRFLA